MPGISWRGFKKHEIRLLSSWSWSGMEQKRDRDPDPDLNLVYLTIMSPTWPRRQWQMRQKNVPSALIMQCKKGKPKILITLSSPLDNWIENWWCIHKKLLWPAKTQLRKVQVKEGRPLTAVIRKVPLFVILRGCNFPFLFSLFGHKAS